MPFIVFFSICSFIIISGEYLSIVLFLLGTTFLELWFLEEPRDSVVTRGSSALLNCSVHSNVPVEIQWLKDGITVQNDSRR